jgi:biopolymer transport protein TolR
MQQPTAQGGFRSEIDVTPLVDVCLVLLIIFMIVTPMIYQQIPVQLPDPKD